MFTRINPNNGEPLTYLYGNVYGSVSISVIENATGEPKQGLRYEILNEDGTLFHSFTTNATGGGSKANVPVGKYTLRFL